MAFGSLHKIGRLYDETIRRIKRRPSGPLNYPPDKKKGLRSYFRGVNKKGYLRFETDSRTVKGKKWKQVVYLKDLDKIALQKKPQSIDKVIDKALAGNVAVHCDCPKFHYWGFKYMAWKRGYGIEEETRYPVVRNKRLQGGVCHHLEALLFVNHKAFRKVITIALMKYVKRKRMAKG